LYPALALQPSGQVAFPGEAGCSHAWDSLCLWKTTKGGGFSVQEFASKSGYAFVLLFYYLTVLCSIHYMKHFCSPVCSFACLWLKNTPFTWSNTS